MSERGGILIRRWMVRGNADLIKGQRRQRFFEQWSKIRAEGAVKFGLKVTTLSTVGFFVPVSALQFFEDALPSAERLLLRLMTSVVSGVILSAMSWWANEGKYKNILIDNRIRARETQ